MTNPCSDYPWFSEPIGPFRHRFYENFEALMHNNGRSEHDRSSRIERSWRLSLMLNEEAINLHVYEEKFDSSHPNCEQCRCSGWQHHPVSKTKVHFILPQDKYKAMDFELFDSKTHIFHGTVHTNGFGHLLRVNGLEGGSTLLRGHQIMTFWIALCRLLRIRDVTTEDVSNKRGMLLRILLPIARKTTFYMKYGYMFGRGQFNVNETDWKRASETLNQTKLCDLLFDFQGVDSIVQKIIIRYSALRTETLNTFGELLNFMLDLVGDERTTLQFLMEKLEASEISHCQDLETSMQRVMEIDEEPSMNGHCLASDQIEAGNSVLTAKAIEMAMKTTKLLESAMATTVEHRELYMSHSMSISDRTERRSGEILQRVKSEEIDRMEAALDNVPATAKRTRKRSNEIPADLKRGEVVPFNAALLFEGNRSYTATKLIEIFRLALGVLQTSEGRWVRLQDIREILYSTAHDRVLADFVLGRMANSTINGFAVYKQQSKSDRCNYFLFEKLDDEADTAEDPLLSSQNQEPLPPAPGPNVVNGYSLERFETYLSRLFHWMVSQPNVSVGRGPNKQKSKTKRKKSDLEREGSIPEKPRTTRAATSGFKRAKLNLPRVIHPWLEVYPSEVVLHLEKITQNFQPGVHLETRKSVLADLLYLYMNTLETYKPLTQAKKKNLKLREFPKYVQMLYDSKFFLWKSDMNPVPEPMTTEASSDEIRLVCRVVLDETTPPGIDRSRLRHQRPEFFKIPPPDEEIFFPFGSSMAMVKEKIESVFRKTYAMFDEWKILTLSNLRLDGPSLEMPSEKVIEIKGNGFSPKLELRHAGGIDDWEVECPCGTRDDDGARMVCCDTCSVWLHTRCLGFRDDTEVPTFFECPHCLASRK